RTGSVPAFGACAVPSGSFSVIVSWGAPVIQVSGGSLRSTLGARGLRQPTPMIRVRTNKTRPARQRIHAPQTPSHLEGNAGKVARLWAERQAARPGKKSGGRSLKPRPPAMLPLPLPLLQDDQLRLSRELADRVLRSDEVH